MVCKNLVTKGFYHYNALNCKEITQGQLRQVVRLHWYSKNVYSYKKINIPILLLFNYKYLIARCSKLDDVPKDRGLTQAYYSFDFYPFELKKWRQFSDVFFIAFARKMDVLIW